MSRIPFDSIQEAVIDRAAHLKLTAYAISKATDGRVSEDQIREYITRRSSMGSHKLHHVFRVLGLIVIAKED